jgi:hypothetical protein
MSRRKINSLTCYQNCFDERGSGQDNCVNLAADVNVLSQPDAMTHFFGIRFERDSNGLPSRIVGGNRQALLDFEGLHFLGNIFQQYLGGRYVKYTEKINNRLHEFNLDENEVLHSATGINHFMAQVRPYVVLGIAPKDIPYLNKINIINSTLRVVHSALDTKLKNKECGDDEFELNWLNERLELGKKILDSAPLPIIVKGAGHHTLPKNKKPQVVYSKAKTNGRLTVPQPRFSQEVLDVIVAKKGVITHFLTTKFQNNAQIENYLRDPVTVGYNAGKQAEKDGSKFDARNYYLMRTPRAYASVAADLGVILKTTAAKEQYARDVYKGFEYGKNPFIEHKTPLTKMWERRNVIIKEQHKMLDNNLKSPVWNVAPFLLPGAGSAFKFLF